MTDQQDQATNRIVAEYNGKHMQSLIRAYQLGWRAAYRDIASLAILADIGEVPTEQTETEMSA